MSQITTAVQASHLYRDEATGTRLRALIADVGRRSGEFPDDLANHLPMVLEAMARLGAPATRLEAYADHYTRSHAVPMQPPFISALDDATWRSALGRREREGDLRRYFSARVAKEGGSATALAVMPVLAPGVAASATHGLMRLAYAFLRHDDAEVAAALGYWAATYLAYKGIPAERVPDAKDPLASLIDMRANPALHNLDAPTHLLWKWIEAMGTLPEFRDRLGRLVAGPDFLDRIRPASLALYAGTMSFEALHAVTGCHWLRLVSPHIGDPQRLALHFWEVVMALYTKIGMPLPPTSEELEEWRHLPLPSDAEIAAAAVASDDEHDHSLVFSAFEEYRYTGDRLYKVVAARRVGLIAG